MVLGDLSLWKLLNDLIREPDPDLVNPASIDVRLGAEMRLEVGRGEFRTVDLTAGPIHLEPGDFALVPTLEWLMVPNGVAVELTLKPSHAQQGYGSAAAVWLDPGWCGVGTMPIRNVTRQTPLRSSAGCASPRSSFTPSTSRQCVLDFSQRRRLGARAVRASRAQRRSTASPR